MPKTPTPQPSEEERKNARLWARLRIDAAIHELHLAEVLARDMNGGFQAGQLRHLGNQLRIIRDRLRG